MADTQKTAVGVQANIKTKKKQVSKKTKTTSSKAKKTLKKAKGSTKKTKFLLQPVASAECLELWNKPTQELEKLMRQGQKPSLEQLAGFRFRGLNVGLGPKLIGIQKFIKCFYLKDYGYGKLLTGCNFMVKQNKPQEEYMVIQKKGQNKIQGYYLVEDAQESRRWKHYPNAALLNYGRGDNAWHEPAGKLRDYLVQPYPNNPNLLLGKAYFTLGPFNIVGGYFILERFDKFQGL